jgi:hypothetical protein
MRTASKNLLLVIILNFGTMSICANEPKFQELPEQDDVFSDQLLNFRVTKPSKNWKFSSVQTSPDFLSRIIGLEYDAAPSTVSPRISIYTHEWGSEDLSKNCNHVRSLGRKYVEGLVAPLGASANWIDGSSPYYGWREACEETGIVWEGNKRLAFVRYVGMPAGTRQFTFVLISRPETWEADNAALTEIVESFGTIEPWRMVKFVSIALLVCLAVSGLMKWRINSTPNSD